MAEDLTEETSGMSKLDLDPEYEVGDFFRENLLKVRNAVDSEEFRKFANLSDNGERVAFVLSLPEAHELPIRSENYEKKDGTLAKTLKDRGNEAFTGGNYQLAMEKYNNAVLVAPKDELGIILANRSAALSHLELYKLALRDCEEAIKIGYPKHLLYKVEERKARCYLGLKCHSKAIEAFKRTLNALDVSDLRSEKRKKSESDVRVMLSILQKGQQINQNDGIDLDKVSRMEMELLREKDETPVVKASNPLYPALSRAVEIKDSKSDVGRYAVATRDVKPGEILAVERPHCAALLDEFRLTHCHRCSIRIGAPYPPNCHACSSIAYCSPDCRDSDSIVHQVECGILGALWCSRSSITCALALKAIIQKPYFDFVKSEKEKIGSPLSVAKEKPYLSDDYAVFYNLVTHEDERTAEDLFHRAYMSAWLFRVLKTSPYFPINTKTPDVAEVKLSDGELFVAGAILRHLQLLQFNAHEISEFRLMKNKPSLTNGKNMFIGGGVYPSVALFNHSCNPGVVRYFVKNAMVVRAIRSISAGSEVCENYGPIFTEVDEKERQRILRLQYWFDCNCEACSKHWPLLENMNPNVLRFKCDTGSSCGNVLEISVDTELFMIPCSKCGKSTNILKGLKAMQDTDALYKNAKKNMENGNHDDALKSLLEMLKILDETLALPVRDYHICQQGVRQCLLALGNSTKV